MRVAEVMTRGIDPVAQTATVRDAATQMAELDVGAVLIGDEQNSVVGILTDRDILLRVVVEGRHPVEVGVADVMSAGLFTCREDDTVEDVLAEMRERQIRRMPVVDDQGNTVGIVVLSDLAKGFSGPEQMQEALRTVSEPHRSREAPDRADARAGGAKASSSDADEEAGEATTRG